MTVAGRVRDVGVLIVDDEAPARTILREYLEKVPGVRILGECGNGFEAVRASGELKPEIVFLDIEMPKLNGFEVLELLEPSIAAIFVTAYDAYAVKAFEVYAVDYVLKPFQAARIAAAVERARERLGRKTAVEPAVLAAAARPRGTWLERIVVRDGGEVHLIPVRRLAAAEAQDDYVALKSEGRTYLKPQTLTSLAGVLDPRRFVRVHRSHLVNLDFVRRLETIAKGSTVAILADGSRVPVSREGHARLNALLG
ncbi:MAG TPA: LytTR family DNA-binding domain-containing protein [Thermoanaerobaculia bacterium]